MGAADGALFPHRRQGNGLVPGDKPGAGRYPPFPQGRCAENRLQTAGRPQGVPGVALGGKHLQISTEKFIQNNSLHLVIILGAGAMGIDKGDLVRLYSGLGQRLGQ